jgi:hypothetical protein
VVHIGTTSGAANAPLRQGRSGRSWGQGPLIMSNECSSRDRTSGRCRARRCATRRRRICPVGFDSRAVAPRRLVN